MGKIIGTIVVVCVMSAPPVLAGYWEYDGTEVENRPPLDWDAPDGTAHCSYSGSGTVYASPTYLEATGRVDGDVWVEGLVSNGETHGGQRGFSVWSRVRGTSSYHWVKEPNDPNTPDPNQRSLTIYYRATLNDNDIYYAGSAINYFGTSPVTCSSETLMQGGGESNYLMSFRPNAYGFGAADGEGNGGADNYYDEVEAIEDYADGGESWGYGWYEGEVKLATGLLEFGPYTDNPITDSLMVTASVDGAAQAQGRIVIEDPELYWSSYYAEGYYYIGGTTEIYLSGKIYDFE
jgi:hypothetical protein